jgi:hypothetical protein
MHKEVELNFAPICPVTDERKRFPLQIGSGAVTSMQSIANRAGIVLHKLRIKVSKQGRFSEDVGYIPMKGGVDAISIVLPYESSAEYLPFLAAGPYDTSFPYLVFRNRFNLNYHFFYLTLAFGILRINRGRDDPYGILQNSNFEDVLYVIEHWEKTLL